MLQQKAKLKQQKTAQKRAEKTTMAAQNCAAVKKFRHLCKTKSIKRIIIERTTDGRKKDSRINHGSPTGSIR